MRPGGVVLPSPWTLRCLWHWQAASQRGAGPRTGSVCSWSLCGAGIRVTHVATVTHVASGACCAQQRGWPGRLFLESSPRSLQASSGLPRVRLGLFAHLGSQGKCGPFSCFSKREVLRWCRYAASDSSKYRNGKPKVKKGGGGD